MGREELRQKLIEQYGISPRRLRGEIWNLRRAKLSGADLEDADLASTDFRGADLRRTNLNGADLRACKFGSQHYLWLNVLGSLIGIGICIAMFSLFRWGNLDLYWSWGIALIGLIFACISAGYHRKPANLECADFTGANLAGASLDGGDFGINLKGTSFRNADLNGALIHERDLVGVDTTGAKNLKPYVPRHVPNNPIAVIKMAMND